MDRITNTHVYFWQDSTMSNWGQAEFEHDGKIFQNSEQAFMWEKAMCFGDIVHALEILTTGKDPKIAKALGRKVKNFDNKVWTEKSYDVMVDVCMAKFKQNEDLKKILLSTGDKTIVEASPYDRVWGVGLHWNDDLILDELEWNGLNLLGKALMEVRRKLQ